MIVKFKTKWNNACDSIANYYTRKNNYLTKENEKTKLIFEKINKFFIYTIPRTYKFISMCNYYQVPTITIFDKNITFDYKKRNILIFTISIGTFFYYKKSFFKTYIGLSTILCRENFNLRYYKFKMLENNDKNEEIIKDNKKIEESEEKNNNDNSSIPSIIY